MTGWSQVGQVQHPVRRARSQKGQVKLTHWRSSVIKGHKAPLTPAGFLCDSQRIPTNITAKPRRYYRKTHRLITISHVVRIGHNRKPAWGGVKPGAPPLLVRRRPDKSRQGPPNQIPLHRPDPNQRVRHGRPPGVKPVRRELEFLIVQVLVKAAAEGPRVRRGRAHARPLLILQRLLLHHLVVYDVVKTGGNGEGTDRGDRTVEREAQGRRRGGGSAEGGGGLRGEGGDRRSENRRRGSGRGGEFGGGRERAEDWAA